MTGRVRFGLRLVIGLGLLGFILARIDQRGGMPHPTGRLGLGVLLAAGLLLASQAIAALRWKLILGAPELPWRYLARLYIIAAFFSLFLPTAVGGDAVRAATLAGAASRPGGAVVSVLLDRLFGVAALLIYAGVGAVAAGLPPGLRGELHWQPSATMLWVGVAALLLGVWALVRVSTRSPRFANLLRQGRAQARDLARSPATVIGAMGLALVVQGLVIVLWIVLARSLELGLSASVFLLAVPLVALGSMLPITVSGLGVREGIWLLLLGGSGLASGTIVGFSLLYFVTTAMVGLVGLVLFVMVGLDRPRPAPPSRSAGAPES